MCANTTAKMENIRLTSWNTTTCRYSRTCIIGCNNNF